MTFVPEGTIVSCAGDDNGLVGSVKLENRMNKFWRQWCFGLHHPRRASRFSETTGMRTRNFRTSIIGTPMEVTHFPYDSSRLFDSSLALAVQLQVAV
jgi:hypothetical protein